MSRGSQEGFGALGYAWINPFPSHSAGCSAMGFSMLSFLSWEIFCCFKKKQTQKSNSQIHQEGRKDSEGCHLSCFFWNLLNLCVTVKRIPVQGILSICLVSNSALAGRLVRLVICSWKNRMCCKIWKVWTTCVMYQLHFLRMGQYAIGSKISFHPLLLPYLLWENEAKKDFRLRALHCSRISASFLKEALFELLYQQKKLCQWIP